VTATEEYIGILMRLKSGDLGLLRTYACQGVAESVEGFDLFSGLWWPLRKKSQRAPRREVAWLVAKLYAACPIPHEAGHTLARQMRKCQPKEEQPRERFRQKFDEILLAPLDKIEPVLRWALDQITANNGRLDWVALTDDLSIWKRDTTRLKWAKQYLNADERDQ